MFSLCQQMVFELSNQTGWRLFACSFDLPYGNTMSCTSDVMDKMN